MLHGTGIFTYMSPYYQPPFQVTSAEVAIIFLEISVVCQCKNKNMIQLIAKFQLKEMYKNHLDKKKDHSQGSTAQLWKGKPGHKCHMGPSHLLQMTKPAETKIDFRCSCMVQDCKISGFGLVNVAETALGYLQFLVHEFLCWSFFFEPLTDQPEPLNCEKFLATKKLIPNASVWSPKMF